MPPLMMNGSEWLDPQLLPRMLEISDGCGLSPKEEIYAITSRAQEAWQKACDVHKSQRWDEGLWNVTL